MTFATTSWLVFLVSDKVVFKLVAVHYSCNCSWLLRCYDQISCVIDWCLENVCQPVLRMFWPYLLTHFGCNQIILLSLLIIFLLSSVLKPPLLNASPYWCFNLLKISSLDEFFDSLSLIMVVSCFKIWGGWLEETFIYISLSFSFL